MFNNVKRGVILIVFLILLSMGLKIVTQGDSEVPTPSSDIVAINPEFLDQKPEQIGTTTEYTTEYVSTTQSSNDDIYAKKVCFYDEKQKRNIGSSGYPNDTIDFEGTTGLRLKLNGTKLLYQYYYHADVYDTKDIPVYFAAIKEIGSEEKTLSPSIQGKIHYDMYEGQITDQKRINPANPDKWETVDLKNLNDGLYIIRMWDSYDESYIDGNILIKNHKPSLVRIFNDSKENFNKVNDKYQKLIAELNMNDCLNFDILTYPTSGENGNCNHRDEWAKISKTIIKNDNWTDEAKVLSFVKWLAKNVAYDEYKANTKNNTRCKSQSDYCKDELFTLKTRTGVCWDYTNILCIMCRANNIPCTSVETYNHVWNLVYLNDSWVPIDVCSFYKYECAAEDTDSKNWIPVKAENYKDKFGVIDPNQMPATAQHQIWDKDIALGNKYSNSTFDPKF